MLGEHGRIAGAEIRLEGVHRRLLVVAVVALDGRGIHGHDDLRAGRAHHAHDAAEQLLPAPHLPRKGCAGGVEEIEGVEIVDVLDACESDGISLLRLADESERGPLLEPDGVSAALTARRGDDADLHVVEFSPLPERREGAGLVIGMGPDEQDVELHGVRSFLRESAFCGSEGEVRAGECCGQAEGA